MNVTRLRDDTDVEILSVMIHMRKDLVKTVSINRLTFQQRGENYKKSQMDRTELKTQH